MSRPCLGGGQGVMRPQPPIEKNGWFGGHGPPQSKKWVVRGGPWPPQLKKMGGLGGHGPHQSKNGRRKKMEKKREKWKGEGIKGTERERNEGNKK